LIIGRIDFTDPRDGKYAGYTELSLDGKLVHMSDRDLAFIIATIHGWRDYIKARERGEGKVADAQT
jgi:hypothetical protein